MNRKARLQGRSAPLKTSIQRREAATAEGISPGPERGSREDLLFRADCDKMKQR